MRLNSDGKPGIRVSATSLITFQNCPRQYRYIYIERLPTIPTPALHFGRAMHLTLAQLNAVQIEEGRLPDVAEALDCFERCWRETAEDGAPEQTGEYAALAGSILLDYVNGEERRPPPMTVEFPFSLPLLVSGEEVAFNGIIDRLDEHDGRLVVVEYKTGKRKPSLKALSVDLQLTCYAFAVARIFDAPTVTLAYRHLRGNAILMTSRDESDFRLLAESVIPPVVAAVRENRFPPRYGWRCRFCDFADLCAAEGPEETFDSEAPALSSLDDPHCFNPPPAP